MFFFSLSSFCFGLCHASLSFAEGRCLIVFGVCTVSSFFPFVFSVTCPVFVFGRSLVLSCLVLSLSCPGRIVFGVGVCLCLYRCLSCLCLLVFLSCLFVFLLTYPHETYHRIGVRVRVRVRFRVRVDLSLSCLVWIRTQIQP